MSGHQLSLSHIVSCWHSRHHLSPNTHRNDPHLRPNTTLNAYQRPSNHDRHSSHIPHDTRTTRTKRPYCYLCSSPPAILNRFLLLCTGFIPSIILFTSGFPPLTILMPYPKSLIVACNYPYDLSMTPVPLTTPCVDACPWDKSRRSPPSTPRR